MNRLLINCFKTVFISTLMIFIGVIVTYTALIMSTYSKIQAITYQMSTDISRHNYLTVEAASLFTDMFDRLSAQDDTVGNPGPLEDLIVDITYNSDNSFVDVDGSPVNGGDPLTEVRAYGDAHVIVVKMEYKGMTFFGGNNDSEAHSLRDVTINATAPSNRFIQYEYIAPCLRYIKDGTDNS